MKVILLIVLCVVLSNAIGGRRLHFPVRKDLAIREQFEEWVVAHGKNYATPEEKELRFTNFQASLDRISKKNARSKTATYALNKFSDMSPAEFKASILMKPITPPSNEERAQNMLQQKVKAAPNTFDWRTQGVVSAVKDQEQCGSCWAFSVTENIESVWMLYNKIQNTTMKPLSPQQIVDCDTADSGCGGGEPTTAYEYVIGAGGLDTLASYPYTAEDGTCAFKSQDVESTINNWKYGCSDEDEKTMAANLANWAPLSICVDAEYWQDYQSGVLTAWECAWINSLDHCVQAVGYDLTASTPYWIVRNSWGTSWGINGYILLEYGANTCGLTQLVTTSITNK